MCANNRNIDLDEIGNGIIIIFEYNIHIDIDIRYYDIVFIFILDIEWYIHIDTRINFNAARNLNVDYNL